MGYFANISGSLVVEHFTGDTIPTSSGNWISHSFSHVYEGFTYDSSSQVFYPPQLYPSWTLDKDTQMWEPPIPEPTRSGDELYYWNENNQTWVSSSI
jgi:hypothetical protein